MSDENEENPNTVFDGTALDGGAIEQGWESFWNWSGDKLKKGVSWGAEKAKEGLSWGAGVAATGLSSAFNFGLEQVGIKDVDNDGKKDFDWMKMLTGGGTFVATFAVLNKMVGMGWFKSFLWSAAATLAFNFLSGSFKKAADKEAPKTELVAQTETTNQFNDKSTQVSVGQTYAPLQRNIDKTIAADKAKSEQTADYQEMDAEMQEELTQER